MLLISEEKNLHATIVILRYLNVAKLQYGKIEINGNTHIKKQQYETERFQK